MNICEREDLIIANLERVETKNFATSDRVTNGREIKRILKDKYITLRNAANQLNIRYEYLVKTLGGYEPYWNTITALRNCGIDVHYPLVPNAHRQHLKN